MLKKFVLFLGIIFWFNSQLVFANQIEEYGKIAHSHLLSLSLIGSRALTTESERSARDYISEELKRIDYKPKFLKFKVEDYQTCNIEVNRKGKDRAKTVILGAHYDGRMEGNACDDNGSGVSILLELCEIFREQELPFNLKFIFFGAEEINVLGRGLHGSYDYVESLSNKEKENIMYMINLDTLLSGDKMYVYNAYNDVSLNDFNKELVRKVKNISERMEIDLNLNCNKNENISFTKTKSDYYPFFENNIPVLYFESTNWEAGEKDGRSQSDLFGRIIHSKMDNMVFIESVFGDRINTRLKSYVELIKELILSGE